MSVTGRFTFYDVTACGYFALASDVPEFGGLADTLAQLALWVKTPGSVLRDTCTYEPVQDGEIMRTFCFDVHHNDECGDYLLTTWNEIESHDGSTATVRGGEPVGRAHVDLTALPAGGIPGYATYFWFIPSRQQFATVTFDQLLNGHPNLLAYMNGFLRSFSQHVVRNTDAAGNIIDVEGYRENDGADVAHLYPRYLSEQSHNRTSIQFITRRRAAIKKFIRKMEVHPNIHRETTFLQRIYENITGLHRQQPHAEGIKVKYEVSATPSADELAAMIETWRSSRASNWEDVGFEIDGDTTKVRWLSHSLARADFELDVEGQIEPAIGAENLLNAILEKRDNILAISSRRA